VALEDIEMLARKQPFAACGKLTLMLHEPRCEDMRRQLEFRCAEHTDLSDCPDSLVVCLEWRCDLAPEPHRRRRKRPRRIKVRRMTKAFSDCECVRWPPAKLSRAIMPAARVFRTSDMMGGAMSF